MKNHNRLYRRIPKDYDGSGVTSRHLKDLLPSALNNIGGVYQERGDLLLAAWPEVIGSQLAAMTQAVSFEQGVLLVKVKNSTLYSLLNQHDKPKILKKLRDRFPTTRIDNVQFRLG
jgi:hypothetical protein